MLSPSSTTYTATITPTAITKYDLTHLINDNREDI